MVSPLAWPDPCLICGLEVKESDQDPAFRMPMHNACTPEYHAAQLEHYAEAARDRRACQPETFDH